jgi:hypothetical protein
MPRQPGQHAPEDLCIHCRRRKKHKSGDYCPSCKAVLVADGVIKPRKGVPFMTRYKQYLTRFEKGMTQQEIAKDLGLDISYVENIATRARNIGLYVPTRPPGIANKITEHGGGTTGVRGCNCGKCVATRREYKALWKKNTAERIARGEQEPKTNHGEGSRGVQGCKCDLCVQCRRAYRRAWEADVKANGKRRSRNASVAQSGSSS